ncbi:M20 metallopeptidase family protein [Wohlfahrtiimonas populi]|uniref:M20 metallopeptidase family protein n=1 Tax=Wohlfahrtiimonas populi TaxID=1940240 RepID=UPI00098D6025|nr:amidohydrolase [Wohlfahrtiimonas populi]
MNIIHQDALAAYQTKLLEYRRYLHAHPELSFQEVETQKYIIEHMSKLKHAEIIKPVGTSVLVKFVTGKAGPKIGLRADIDALPILEERHELEFKSKRDGVMHACGHDIHTSMLMTACHYFDEHFDNLTGEVWAIFQHAEELLPGGAQEMVATGLFNELDFIYGQHIWSNLPIGTIDVKDGPASSNTDAYIIKIQGKGGHASQPENSIDPVIIGAMIVQKLQTIVSRMISPQEAGVISNTYFNSGRKEAINVIPDVCYLGGSVRSSSEAMRHLFKDTITKMVNSTCAEYGATCEIDYTLGYGVTYNNPEKTAFVRAIANGVEGATVIADKCMLGGEDFSAFSSIVPSTFVFVGGGNPKLDFDYPHHHPKFGIDEDGMMHGLQLLINVVEQYPAYFK